MKILVTGATGYVGGRLVPRLLERGHEVVCFAREPAHLAGRGWEGVRVVRGDALETGSFLPAMEGVDRYRWSVTITGFRPTLMGARKLRLATYFVCSATGAVDGYENAAAHPTNPGVALAHAATTIGKLTVTGAAPASMVRSARHVPLIVIIWKTTSQ